MQQLCFLLCQALAHPGTPRSDWSYCMVLSWAKAAAKIKILASINPKMLLLFLP
jgi:hypothetical protein